jgi:hypothetical protein
VLPAAHKGLVHVVHVLQRLHVWLHVRRQVAIGPHAVAACQWQVVASCSCRKHGVSA